MDDDDFIRNLKETLTQRAGAEEEQVKQENREFAQIAAKAPDDWKRLKTWLREKIAQLPTELVGYEEKLDSAEIKYRIARGMRTTEITFRHVEKVMTQIVVEARGGAADGDFTFECNMRGQKMDWFYATNQKVIFDVPGIGKAILTEATKG
jgi:hypothetical protein